MPIIARDNTTDFEPAPEGLHQAVCVDVVDLGEIESQWGKRHYIQIRWQIDEVRDDGKPFLAMRRFALSLHEKSTLRPFLEAWRGKRFTAEELRGFDLEKLIGANCQLQIIHAAKDGRVFANVQSAVPLMKGVPRLEVRDYQRVSERTPEAEPPPEEPDELWEDAG